VPEASVEILARVGCWMNRNGEAIRDTDIFTYGLTDRRGHHSDWSHQGLFTRSGKVLYHLVRYWPGGRMVVAGLNTVVEQVSLLRTGEALRFTQQDGKVTVFDLPEAAPDPICTVLKFVCADVPEIYLAGGMRIPTVAHPPYDPCPSDILHGYPTTEINIGRCPKTVETGSATTEHPIDGHVTQGFTRCVGVPLVRL